MGHLWCFFMRLKLTNQNIHSNASYPLHSVYNVPTVVQTIKLYMFDDERGSDDDYNIIITKRCGGDDDGGGDDYDDDKGLNEKYSIVASVFYESQ